MTSLSHVWDNLDMTIEVQPEKKPYMELIPGLWCPPKFAVFASAGEFSQDVLAEVVPDVAQGLLVVRRLEVQQRVAGEPITSVALRSIAVGKLVRACVPFLQMRTTDAESGAITRTGTPWLSGEDLEHARENGPDSQTLQRVAHIYRLSLLREGTPTKAVSSAFQVSQATAARWVTKSRYMGFLGPVKGQGRAGVLTAGGDVE